MNKPNNIIRGVISIICLVLIIVHAIYPDITIDSNTIILLIFMFLPWLSPFIESISFAGNTVKFRKQVEKLVEKKDDDDTILKFPPGVAVPPERGVEVPLEVGVEVPESQSIPPDFQEKVITGIVSEDPLLFTAEDPNLVLAALRIEMEKKIREIAQVSNIPAKERTVNNILDSLVNQRRIPHSTSRFLADILQICNRAVHGAVVDAFSAARVLRIGKDAINWIDSIIELIKTIDYTFEY